MQLLAGKDQVLPHESPSPKSTSYNAQVNRQVCYSENYTEDFYLIRVFQIPSVIVVWCDGIHGMHLPCINPKKSSDEKDFERNGNWTDNSDELHLEIISLQLPMGTVQTWSWGMRDILKCCKKCVE